MKKKKKIKEAEKIVTEKFADKRTNSTYAVISTNVNVIMQLNDLNSPSYEVSKMHSA